jgi:hypothetical protein
MLEQRLGARFVSAPRSELLRELEKQAAYSDLLVIESTGENEREFESLRARFEVLFVRVHAERTTCDARSSEPDAEEYERSSSIPLPWDLELYNEMGLDARSVVDAVRPLLRA